MITEVLPECPTCHATGKRCKRPSGHDASEWHAARRALMVERVLDGERVEVAPAGRYTDPERQALAASDEEANAKLAEDGPALDGDRCHQCKGFGLVRGVGKNAGQRYRTLTGAQVAQDAGRAVDCPVCAGLGLVGFEPSTHPEDGTRVIDTGRAILADSPLVEAARESGRLQVITVGR